MPTTMIKPSPFAKINAALQRRKERDQSLAHLTPYLAPNDTARKWVRRRSSTGEPFPISVWYRHIFHDVNVCVIFPRHNYGPVNAEVIIYKIPGELDLQDHLVAADQMALYRKTHKIAETSKSLNELLDTLIHDLN